MARVNPELITALRETALRLQDGAFFQWSNMGGCNCGHLAQTVTKLSKAEIHARALEKAGDWSQQSIDYCPDSGYPIDHVISSLLELGLNREDLAHLERLSDSRVLRRLPLGERDLTYTSREDSIRYMNAWADLLEEQYLAAIPAPVLVPAGNDAVDADTLA